ncbi:hypothetical protein FACUT_2643 [Fusarium acutatum]|uniref:YTH domain-containing protein n=1 Tax=Fusarium acutatum TaxID=78861 RepID=A0A8H4K1M6_9HYPO|nr:hypothetical protein FACUT_2643 [Fusarium acutatum]
MPKNTRRGSGGHSYRPGPYERPQNEGGGRGRGRGGYTPYPAGGHGRGAFSFDGGNGPGGYHPSQGSGWGRGAGAGGPNLYEGPGRAADPEFRVGGASDQGFYAAGRHDAHGREQGYSHFDNSQQSHQECDGQDGYGYEEYDGPRHWDQQWDEEDGYDHQENEQEAPSYDAQGNEHVAEEAQSASHEVTRVFSMSCVPHGRGFCMYNSKTGGKQENVVGWIDLNEDQRWPKNISIVIRGQKKTLSQEELSKAKVPPKALALLTDWHSERSESRQMDGWNQAAQRLGSGSMPGRVNEDSRDGTQPSATERSMNPDPVTYFLGSCDSHLSHEKGR